MHIYKIYLFLLSIRYSPTLFLWNIFNKGDIDFPLGDLGFPDKTGQN